MKVFQIMILKLASFARMILSRTPMHLAFTRPATAECFLTIDFVQVDSDQPSIIPNGEFSMNDRIHTGSTKFAANIQTQAWNVYQFVSSSSRTDSKEMLLRFGSRVCRSTDKSSDRLTRLGFRLKRHLFLSQNFVWLSPATKEQLGRCSHSKRGFAENKISDCECLETCLVGSSQIRTD
jgi:hypothetical protein